jgi:hypothetical protein
VPTKGSAIALAHGARIEVLMIRMPSAQNTSSKLAVNFVSRSRMRNSTGDQPDGRVWDLPVLAHGHSVHA